MSDQHLTFIYDTESGLDLVKHWAIVKQALSRPKVLLLTTTDK